MDKILEWYGNERYARNLKKVNEFWDGKRRFIISINSSCDAYRQVFDEAVIIDKAPRNFKDLSTLPGTNMPALFCDLGTISNPKLWGGEARFDSTGGYIFIEHVAQSCIEACAITPKQPWDPSTDAAYAIRVYKKICEHLETSNLWLRTPDMQGPLNTASMIVQQENFMTDMYSAPDDVHALLDKITTHLITLFSWLKEKTGNKLCGNIWPYSFYPSSRGIALTEDYMPLLPVELYQEFGIPALRKLQAACGGFLVHCCGEYKHHIPTWKNSGIKLDAIEFHYPYVSIEDLEPLAEHTAFIPFLAIDKQDRFTSNADYYEWLLKETPSHFRYWFPWYESNEEALTFTKKFDL